MTLKQIVKQLLEKGHKITYTLRKDGSIVIRRIDGVAYQNKQGNAEARALAGVKLSPAKEAQLLKLRTPTGRFGNKATAPLPDPIRKELRKAQRVFRKRGVKEGKPTTRNIRYTLREYGEAEVYRRLKQAIRYARGVAYPENVRTLSMRILADANKLAGRVDGDIIRRLYSIAEYLAQHAEDDTILERQIQDILDVLYAGEGGNDEWANVADYLENVLNI